MRRFVILALLGVVQGCACEEEIWFVDGFGPTDEAGDALHTYASHALVNLQIASAGPDLAALRGEVDGVLTLDAEEDGALPELKVRTGEAGSGTIRIVDADGFAISERTVSVVDVDDLALSVTAAAAPGIVLPDVELSGTRIFASGKAAFRTTFFAAGVEVFGLDATTATPTEPTVTTRNGIGSAADARNYARNAVEIAVPDEVPGPFDVTIAAGTATTTLAVVPTRLGELTDFVLEEQDTTGAAEGDDLWVVAHVLAGTEPVFGVPVRWTYRGNVLVDPDTEEALQGDLLQFKYAPEETVEITAAFAGLSAIDTVSGEAGDATVGSITGACGAGGTPLPILLALLLTLRPRARN